MMPWSFRLLTFSGGNKRSLFGSSVIVNLVFVVASVSLIRTVFLDYPFKCPNRIWSHHTVYIPVFFTILPAFFSIQCGLGFNPWPVSPPLSIPSFSLSVTSYPTLASASITDRAIAIPVDLSGSARMVVSVFSLLHPYALLRRTSCLVVSVSSILVVAVLQASLVLSVLAVVSMVPPFSHISVLSSVSMVLLWVAGGWLTVWSVSISVSPRIVHRTILVLHYQRPIVVGLHVRPQMERRRQAQTLFRL